ncbi:Uncharacterised protein [Actinobacillus pleuropneumoniae]|uniref:hypothetical protein n=1 Tax=Actinobacillus pleuropneumoniae TaxID=715 RepID=UPI0001E4A252|nr:hypothetical protein [Actinobacillus pleuropneumoniae]EFM88737.1 Variable tail fiber protein H [Actinobacillus pleuropneumoniae serovar 4 str. M62]UKH41029.1 hypothetical protein D1097_04245 [Actinobacillus pleuropneumoniae serovar 4 str. M62]SQF64560.1 Uncharacterised protein [Actinobacillus pleuropneumoniae]
MAQTKIDLMDLFQRIKWASSGTIHDMSKTNYNWGWGYLGDDTPTVQDFNFVQQKNDEKDKWLFDQINEVLKDRGITASDDEVTSLRDAIKGMIETFKNDLKAPDGFKFIGQCESIEQLRTIEPTEHNQRILVKSYYAGTNIGGGEFYADLQDSTTADNAGTVVVTASGKRWKRIYTNITPEAFGAVGDGVTNDLTALKAASAFNSVVLRNDAVYYIGNATSSDFDPDFIAKGLGKIKWGARELDGYELKKDLKSESIYLAPKSWHEATRVNSTISPAYPPYAPPERGNDIYNKYNTVVSWRSSLNNPNLKITAVTAYGANIGVRPDDWELTDAYGQDAMMFAKLSERNTALGSETMVWLGAPSKDYLIETNHDWYRNTPPNKWTSENSDLEAIKSGTGGEIYAFSDYPKTRSDVAHNTAVGRDALLHLVKGNRNTAVGYAAGAQAFSANDNVYIGVNAGRNSVWGDNNTAIGAQALKNGIDVSQTVALGYGAARENASGYNSVILGYLAAQKAKIIRNSIILGAYAAQTLESLIDKLVIGSVIFGNLSTNKIGINVDEPLADLHIRSKNNNGSGRTEATSGLLVEGGGSVNISVDGTSYANISLQQAGVAKGGFQYGFDAKTLSVITGGVIAWRFDENGAFFPNTPGTQELGKSNKKIGKLHLTKADKAENGDVAITASWFREQYSQALTENGWNKLPNGLIMQWGKVTGIAQGDGVKGTVSLPLHAKILNVSIGILSAVDKDPFILISSVRDGQFDFTKGNAYNSNSDNVEFYWQALTYVA